MWYLDSGCSRHMTSDKTKFAKLELKNERLVTYGDNNKGRILGNGVISNESSFNIMNVLLVEGLKHNLINISQLCNKGFKVVFEPNHCLIYDAYGSIVLIGKKVNNIYLIDLHHASFNIHCLITKEDDTWLWHMRFCHKHMQHFNWLNRVKIMSIRSDHGGEFQNEIFEHFCEKHGIKHNFSALRTP